MIFARLKEMGRDRIELSTQGFSVCPEPIRNRTTDGAFRAISL